MEEVIRGAICATEDGFMTHVERTFEENPRIAGIGSCCLVGVIWGGTLFVANVGDSRAVVGFINESNEIMAEQATVEHNVCYEEIRAELIAKHKNDESIVVQKDGVWRVKGMIQVARSIGDAYLKRVDFAINPTFPKFSLREPIRRYSRAIKANDPFVIFASDGLWEDLSNEEAVKIVHTKPRKGIAKRLVKKAVKKAAQKRDLGYERLMGVQRGERRKIHDDISVVVLFLDHAQPQPQPQPQPTCSQSQPMPQLSVHGFSDSTTSSQFTTLRLHPVTS